MTATGAHKLHPARASGGTFAVRPFAGALALVYALTLVGTLALATPGAFAQAKPSPTAIATARELIAVKGAANMFDPVIPGVIETAKNSFLKTNPQLSKDLNEVAAQLRTEYAGKRADLSTEVATIYAQHFTEKELQDALAFYKTPLGQKLISQEVQVMDQSMSAVQTWADKFADDMLKRFRVEMAKRGHTI